MYCCRYSSGDLGPQLAVETGQVLGLLPVQEHPWLVDYMWRSYCDIFHPYLLLAGPLTGGTAARMFRQYWQSLPWSRATFHCESPGTALDSHPFMSIQEYGTMRLIDVLSCTRCTEGHTGLLSVGHAFCLTVMFCTDFRRQCVGWAVRESAGREEIYRGYI